MKVIVYLASSVNGMISNNRNVPDWLSQEFSKAFMEISQKAGAVIMGKKTYNFLAPEHLPFKDGGSIIVLTHDITAKPVQENVLFTDKSPKEIIDLLESKGHREAIIIGGTATVSEFIKAGLVNELIEVVEPVFFGKGLPMVENVDVELGLQLAEVTKLNEHTVRLHYRIGERRLG